MNRRSKAWIILPVAILLIAVIGLVLSNYQKEAGLIRAGTGGRAAVGAAVAAESLVSADGGATEYAAFSKGLLVALVAHRNMAVGNPAETRLDLRLAGVLDFLSAVREAWQADLDQTWDPRIQGDPAYWRSLHPGLEIGSPGPLTPAAVRQACRAEAGRRLEDAIDLAG